MQILHSVHLPGQRISRSLKSVGLPVFLSLLLGVSMAGQWAPSQGATAATSEPLGAKAIDGRPRHGEEPPSTAHLTPEASTSRTFASDILKRRDLAAFSGFQHREKVRPEEMTALQNYADNLMLAGDLEEGRTIRSEVSRLLLRPHDPESAAVVWASSPRLR